METLDASKHRPLLRYHFQSSTTYFRMDARRKPDGIHQGAPKHGQAYTRKRLPPVLDHTFTPLVSYATSPMAFITSTPATWFMEISREYAIVF